MADSPASTDYVIRICTSDTFGAGTSARVYVQLIGREGKSRELNLDSPEGFYRNTFKSFVFKGEPQVGPIRKLKVWHDNTGLAAAWHLAYIEVEDVSVQKMYRFPCHKWLSTDDDGEICKTLRCMEVGRGRASADQKADGVSKDSITDLASSNVLDATDVPAETTSVPTVQPSTPVEVYGRKSRRSSRRSSRTNVTFQDPMMGPGGGGMYKLLGLASKLFRKILPSQASRSESNTSAAGWHQNPNARQGAMLPPIPQPSAYTPQMPQGSYPRQQGYGGGMPAAGQPMQPGAGMYSPYGGQMQRPGMYQQQMPQGGMGYPGQMPQRPMGGYPGQMPQGAMGGYPGQMGYGFDQQNMGAMGPYPPGGQMGGFRGPYPGAPGGPPPFMGGPPRF